MAERALDGKLNALKCAVKVTFATKGPCLQILWHFKGGQIRQVVVSRQGGDRDVDQKSFGPGAVFGPGQ